MSEPVKKRQLSRRAQLALTVGVLLVVAALGFLLLVSPKRARAGELDAEIAALNAQIATARAESLRAAAPKIRTADVFRLAKAMPDRADMPGILLELSRIAAEAGIVFESITPSVPVTEGTFQTVPINLSFQGNFYSLSDFLFRLRNLVRVRNGELSATGRLFAVDAITFAEGEQSFPHISATLTVNAFVYGTAAPPAAAAPPPAAPPPAPPGEQPADAGGAPPAEEGQAPPPPAPPPEPPPADAAPAGEGS